jgi:hypothetical protein
LHWLPLLALSVSPVPAIAEGISPASNAAGDVVTYLLGFGPIGIGIVLYQLGLIVPKPVLSAVRADAEKWRQAFEDERAAHATTRESLAVANDRAEAAVEAARVTTKLLEVVEQRRDS